MALREPGDADAEAARVGMFAAGVEARNETDQIGGVLKGVLGAIVAFADRGISAEGENVAHAFLGITGEDALDLGLRVAHAGEVRHGVERGGALDAQHEVMREVAGGAACAIGDADEVRAVRLEFANGLVQILRGLGSFWGKNSKENVVSDSRRVSSICMTGRKESPVGGKLAIIRVSGRAVLAQNSPMAALNDTQKASRDQFQSRATVREIPYPGQCRGRGCAADGVSVPPGACALDVATGGGHTALYLAGRGYSVTASDITPPCWKIRRSSRRSAG